MLDDDANDQKFGRIDGLYHDEPAFVLRAKDNCTLDTLSDYRDRCERHGSPQAHLAAIEAQMRRIQRWRTISPAPLGRPNVRRRLQCLWWSVRYWRAARTVVRETVAVPDAHSTPVPNPDRADDATFAIIVHRLRHSDSDRGGGEWLVRVYADVEHIHSAEGGVPLSVGLTEAYRAMLRYAEERIV